MHKDLKEYCFKSNGESLKNMFSLNCLLIFILVSIVCARFQSNDDHLDKIVRLKTNDIILSKTDFKVWHYFRREENYLVVRILKFFSLDIMINTPT
jgi:hypothetical protein